MTFDTGLAMEDGQGEKAEDTETRNLVGRHQKANAIAFAINIAFVAIPGRLDSKLAQEDWPGNGVVSYATPALYAFAIWGAIYITELVFVIWQFTQKAQSAPVRRLAMISALSPGWCAGNCFQALWCLTYRQYMFSFATFWIPAVFLSLAPLSLSFAHRAAAAAAQGAAEEFFVLLPISMHFGWTTAAGLLNWNQWVTLGFPSLTPRLAAWCLTLSLAALAGVGLIVTRRAPGYACTLAWAIIALGVQAYGSDIMAAELGEDGAWYLAMAELTVGVGLAVLGLGAKVAIVCRPVEA